MLAPIKSYVSHGPTCVRRVDEELIIVIISFFVLTRRKMAMTIVNVCVGMFLGV